MADGTYDFSALINQKAGIVNMVAGRKAFAVQAAGVLDPAQAAETSNAAAGVAPS